MRGLNDSISYSLRALLTRYDRTTCRVSLHCRLNVFCLLLCGKNKNIMGRNKKIPKDFTKVKVFGDNSSIYPIMLWQAQSLITISKKPYEF